MVAEINERLIRERRPYVLIGPGRWGSFDPWIGIPVAWHQISWARVIVEVPARDLPMEPSQGTHFFHNMTSAGIGYFSLSDTNEKEFVRWDLLEALPGRGDRARSPARPPGAPAVGAHGRPDPAGGDFVCHDQVEAHPSTGLPALDRILEGLIDGDNVVWQVGSIEDYLPFVRPYCEEALRQGRKLIYFHFERHDELIAPDPRVETHRLDPAVGFETLTAEIHRVIARAGRGAFYLFDCLSDLAADWYSDMMLGNFFMVTCPYLRELDTIAYFALLRRRHSYRAVAAIRDTTQLLLDVHRHEGTLYVHPLKVFERYSPTMYLPHVWEGDAFRPVTESATISRHLRDPDARRLGAARPTASISGTAPSRRRRRRWSGARGERSRTRRETFRHLLRMVISRNERMLELAERYLTLEDLLAVRRRMIGTGLIGGKAAGMLVARAILRRAAGRWQEILEPHDSFFVGSDVFYSYLVSNGCWRMRQKQRDSATFLDGRGARPGADAHGHVSRSSCATSSRRCWTTSARRRSSCARPACSRTASATPSRASTRASSAPTRARRRSAWRRSSPPCATSTPAPWGARRCSTAPQRGLLDRDEQMALLVQRVSGAVHGRLFFPQVAGVGLSFNPFVWSEQIDPEAGVLRLVFGLGTRAVRRSDDDYTRIVALNAPARRPETTLERGARSTRSGASTSWISRRRSLARVPSKRWCKSCGEQPIEMVAWRDPGADAARAGRRDARSSPGCSPSSSSSRRPPSSPDMRALLETLEKAYDYPVDVEFTANFLPDGSYRINLVQCRPFQVKGGGPRRRAAGGDRRRATSCCRAQGAVIGPSLVDHRGTAHLRGALASTASSR